MSRLLVVSNRLPVTVSTSSGSVVVEVSSGGLATGMSGPHEKSGGLWIGWPGSTSKMDDAQRESLDAELRQKRLEPVHLTDDEIERYYEGFSNGLLWPLFHYMLDAVPLRVDDWDSYASVNAKFADAVARVFRPGDRVWVHDYQLMLVPQLLRERVPHARIGFFLHIPFPASAVLRALPKREELLRGVLGADLIGFHTPSYLRHFASALLRILGLETRVDRVVHEGREIALGAFPMGVDAEDFGRLGASEPVRARALEVQSGDGCRLLVGIDRLDYTKGIQRRLLAFEELLSSSPDLYGKVRLIQVAVPSRTNIPAYREFTDSVDALVGRIQGRFATPTWSPVRYVHRNLSREEVAALYLAADVLLVTPIRDGMNLVAKEFVAVRNDEDGVLVLSEFAGAAAELDGALLVNPYDVEASARTYRRALDMPREERRDRMRRLRRRVTSADVHDWAGKFLAELDATGATSFATSESAPAALRAALERIGGATSVDLVLDYDGTLVPFAESPLAAAPDRELLELLGSLARANGVRVHLVSGRPREQLDAWFGSLDAVLSAEHGLWSRTSRGAAWTRVTAPPLPFAGRIGKILEDWSARTPGSFVERKSEVLAWHWRAADPIRGRAQESELRLHLAELLANVPVEVVAGDRVIEVRPHGVHKGLALGARSPEESALVVALGDDRTDEDVFAALRPTDVAIHVGPRPSRAPLRLSDPRSARAFLRALLDVRGG